MEGVTSRCCICNRTFRTSKSIENGLDATVGYENKIVIDYDNGEQSTIKVNIHGSDDMCWPCAKREILEAVIDWTPTEGYLGYVEINGSIDTE